LAMYLKDCSPDKKGTRFPSMAFHTEHYNVLLSDLAPIQSAMLLPVRLSPGRIK
jgi:hypothetical protein